jgi:hypothetical protein
VWSLIKKAMANEASKMLDMLEEKVCSRCQTITSEDLGADKLSLVATSFNPFCFY